MRLIRWSVLAIISTLLAFPATEASADDLPRTTHDGLVLLEDSKVRAAYIKPGASLEPYSRLVLLDCYVAFTKDWQKEHNREAVGLGERVSDEDMARIKERLAAEFRKVFSQELEEEGGYEIVDGVGPDVLILRPAIINLNPVAPDVGAPGWSHTLVTSVGQMTLYLELYDGPTGDIIARIVDPESADRGGMALDLGRGVLAPALHRGHDPVAERDGPVAVQVQVQ